MLFVLDNYDSFTYNLVQYFGELGAEPVVYRNDALTHVGQISMLRRLASAPVKGENYFKADIASGRVSKVQTAPRMEFD